MNFENFDIAFSTEHVVIMGLMILIILLSLWMIRIEKKLKTLLATKNAKTLDDTLSAVSKNLTELNRFREKTDSKLENLEKRVSRNISVIETVRFNPFAGDGSGGNHSFATAFLSERGDGIVLSSLYTRDRTNIFSKRLENFNSDQGLTEEEQGVIKKAFEKTR